MNASTKEYLYTFASLAPSLSDRLSSCFKDWEFENPPVTIIFSELGDAIIDNFDKFPEKTKKRIFSKIEEGIIDSNVELKTVVATGLIETLVTRTDKRKDFWVQLEKCLGPASVKHALGWKDFGKNDPPR